MSASESQLRSFPPTSAETNSLTNRLWSLFSPHHRHNDSTSSSNLTNDPQLIPPCRLPNLTPPGSAADPTNNPTLTVFARQFDGGLREARPKSASSCCLDDETGGPDLTRMNLTNRRDVGRPSIASQPLSVDSMLGSSRSRKSGVANIWSIGEEDEDGASLAPKHFGPRHSFSLPPNPEFVSFLSRQLFL